MAAHPYSETAAYREGVVAAMTRTAGLPSVLEGVSPAASCVRYSHLALACRDVEKSVDFYRKLGFARVSETDSSNIVRLRHVSNGLDLHLVSATDTAVEGNVLMDTPTLKHAGHTHASWTVPSVPGVKELLSSIGVELSGTRSTLAVFVRDVDRTTLELERNDGGDELPSGGVTPQHIGGGKPLDHVGIRVRAPFASRVEWYARALGFNLLVMNANEDEPLKNMPPWVTRSVHGCDVNFIINCNTAQASDNILFSGGATKPGILYPAFEIPDSDAASVRDRLRAINVEAVLDTELGAASWVPAAAVRLFAGGPTVLVRDMDGNIVRLVPADVART